ncbi:MAG: phage tail sheath subtilisin-like domain-containing protein [Chloroflexi bacterium]|nr:phage tail sheath subtilisin-like domain-containing protein [Chloroflexota bacterium]
MPEYLAPGVYVEEVDRGTRPIEGVSTSTAGFVGMTLRGPTVGLPALVTSFADFRRKFGDYFDFGATFAGHNYLPYAVEGFFTNGGQRAYIMRVMPASAAKSNRTSSGGLVTRLKPGENAAVGQAKLKLLSLRGLSAGSKLRLRMVKDGITYESADLTIVAGGLNRASNEVTVSANIGIAPAGPAEFDARLTSVFSDVGTLATAPAASVGLVTALGSPVAARPNSFVVRARSQGAWGDSLSVQAEHSTAARAELDTSVSGGILAGPPDNQLVLKTPAGFYVGAWVEIDRGDEKRYRKVLAVLGNVVTLDGAALNAAAIAPQAPATTTVLSVCEFKLSATYGGVTEQFGGLTLENVTGKYFANVINGSSTLIEIDTAALPAGTHPFLYPSAPDGLRFTLTGGNNGAAAPTDADYKGVDNGPGNRTGLKALEDIDQVSILAVPGITTQSVQNAMIEQCERLKERFAVLDPRPKAGDKPPDLDDIQSQRGLFDTKYAALYYPRLVVDDPLTDGERAVPPSGHMIGIYARTDDERGVHKAPANTVIFGINGLELTINRGEHDILNPLNINVLRDFRADRRGYRVYGARCLTADTLWKYVPVRRLFIFLEESLDEGTQWVVFEPNDEPLWARVRQSVELFLTRVWRDGALMGATPEQAFYVRCDYSTMTQDDIDNGRLIMEIGVAPVKPAEFVIIRIGQKPGGATIEEA